MPKLTLPASNGLLNSMAAVNYEKVRQKNEQ